MPFDNNHDLAVRRSASAASSFEVSAPHRSQSGKRVFDFIAALLLAPFVAVAVLFLAALIFAVDGQPAFFGQMRVGRGGRLFRCWKLRTMVRDAEARLASVLESDPAAAEEWVLYQKLRNDPRVTPLGRFLRKTSLDELPQLWNVLRGEMSLVGPRPIVTDEIARYGSDISFYCAVRPGVTGLWQVSGRSGTSYEERVAMDRRYVEERTLGGDVALIARTVMAVLTRRGAA